MSSWARARFKGKEVWAEVDDAGQPKVEGGRRVIRYSEAPGATLYRAGASGVEDLPGERRTLPEGQDAPDRAPGRGGEGGRPGGRGSGFGSAGTRSAAQTDAARKSAQTQIAELPPGTILGFTDGACSGNPGPAGAGAVVRLADGRVVERHRALGEGTNNVGELVAIGMALELCREAGVPQDAPIAIFTDSDYARGVLTLNWKPKVNGGLVSALKRALAQWPQARVHWVAGHVGIPENERADALARRGVEESRRM